MSDIKRQRNCFFFFFSPNFVYSVIINQCRCMTAFRAQTDTKDMWRDYDGKKERGERGRWKRGCHRNSFLNFQGSAEMNWVCVSLEKRRRACAHTCTCVCVYMGLCSWVPNSACDWQLYSRNALWLCWSWLLGLYLWGFTEKFTAANFKYVTDQNILCFKPEESRWTHGTFRDFSENNSLCVFLYVCLCDCVWSLER